MAGEAAIIDVVDKCLVYCRRHSNEEREAGIDLWVDLFANTSTMALNRAARTWMEDLDPNEPNPTLPRPGVIRAIIRQQSPAPTGPRPHDQPLPPFARPSREFRRLHREAIDKITALTGGIVTHLNAALSGDRPDHVHKPEEWADDGSGLIWDGTEDCPRCRIDREQGSDTTIRRQIADILAELPEPRESSMPCPCNGSGGWVDNMAEGMADKRMPTVVTPCQVCLPDKHARLHGREPDPEPDAVQGKLVGGDS